MLKLYYSPGACSLSPHIALIEAGLDFEIEKVDLKAKTTETGADYAKINPKGYVPALLLEDGSLMGEGPALVQYIADHAPAKKLAPKHGSMDRYRLMEWLNFITTELHKGFSPIFGGAPEEYLDQVKARLNMRLQLVEDHFASHGKDWLMGETFTVADGYLFTVLRWAVAKKVGDLPNKPCLTAFMARMKARPAVSQAMAEEGLS